jgi:hypothetical protein
MQTARRTPGFSSRSILSISIPLVVSELNRYPSRAAFEERTVKKEVKGVRPELKLNQNEVTIHYHLLTERCIFSAGAEEI